ncbi:hypothetical protein CKAN_01216300 [Cinnamomum micranthum f. kanehirae]|uniref:Uncharacterized protein n=1 Tax=Cinnamomum micranthum f. kanehirae TaxID=337451 RepID=A0A443NY29_9MAGN|nr:hypothetical protein CKAN_01216300 [Cinnamomum micranthum f. kanehirae]
MFMAIYYFRRQRVVFYGLKNCVAGKGYISYRNRWLQWSVSSSVRFSCDYFSSSASTISVSLSIATPGWRQRIFTSFDVDQPRSLSTHCSLKLLSLLFSAKISRYGQELDVTVS